MTPPTAGTRTITLERYTVKRLPKGVGPYTGIDTDGDGKRDEWRTNYQQVYVRRSKPHVVRLTPHHGFAKRITADELEAVKRIARKRGWDLKVKRDDITITRDRWPRLGGDLDCDPKLLDALQKTADTLDASIWVRSGKRTMAEQWALYNQLGPGIAAYPSANAPHVRGIAADCSIDGVNIGTWKSGRARAAMDRAGCCLPVGHESWHVQMKSTAAWAPNWRP